MRISLTVNETVTIITALTDQYERDAQSHVLELIHRLQDELQEDQFDCD